MKDDDSDMIMDWEETKCDPNMIVNVSGSEKALEALEWAEEHNLQFELVAEGYIIPLDMCNKVRDMMTPPYSRGTFLNGIAADHDLDFMFLNEEDAVAFKLRWL